LGLKVMSWTGSRDEIYTFDHKEGIMLKTLILTACLVMTPAAAPAGSLSVQGVQIQRAWSRPAAAESNGAGFFTVTNEGRRQIP